MAKGTCPVGLEWEALVAAVGEYEAMRDFMENDETVRDPQIVLEKIRKREEGAIIENEMGEDYWRELYTGKSAYWLSEREEFENINIPGVKNKFVPDTKNLYHGTDTYEIDEDGNLVMIPSLNFEEKTQSISFTQVPVVAQDYMLRKRGNVIIKVKNSALQNYDIESAEEIAVNTDKALVIPKGQYEIIEVPTLEEKMKRKYEAQVDARAQEIAENAKNDMDILSAYYASAVAADNEAEISEYERGYERAPRWYKNDYQIEARAAKAVADKIRKNLTREKAVDGVAERVLEYIRGGFIKKGTKRKTGVEMSIMEQYYNWDTYGSPSAPHGGSFIDFITFDLGLKWEEKKQFIKDVEAKVNEKAEEAFDFYNSPEQVALRKLENEKMRNRSKKKIDDSYDLPFYREETIQDMDNGIIQEQGDIPMQPTQQNQTRGREILTKLMNKLSEAFGIPYQMLTGEEAREMTKSAKTPWNGEKGFYYNGVVYFVGDNLTTNVVLHEFAHPFVEAIRRSNPQLFNNIYSKLMSSPEGQEIIATVARLYPELDTDSDMFKEEVITRAIERRADNKLKNEGSSKGLIGAVKDFLYWVKTKLREMFGRNVTVSKLDVDTSLDELADMLAKGKKFNIMSEVVRSSDAARYLKSMEQEINEAARIKNEDLVELATQGFKAAIMSLESMKDKQNYLEMLEVFKDELGQSNFEEIKKNLSQYRKELDEKMAEMIDQMKYTQDHVESLVNTFYRLSRTIRKISNHLATMINDIDNPEIIAKAQSYAKTLNFWSSFISFSLETFEKNGLSSENEIYKLVSSISEEIVRGNKHLSVINGEGVKSILMKRLAPFGQAVLERMDSMLKTYRKNNAPQSMIDRVYVQVYGMTEAEFNEYEKMKADGRTMEKRYQVLREKLMTGAFVSEEKIEMLLSGQLNDVNWANSYLEGYMYNDDYVVGGFSLFVKDALDEVFVRAQAKYNDFATEIMPLLEENGYNPNNIGELGKKLGFVDSILVYDNKTGKYEKKEVWTFLNPWKDHRYQTDLMNQNIKEARERFNMTNTEEDKIALANAINVKTQHDIDFMHQEFVPEYYDRRNTFTNYGKDQLAVQALSLRDEILRTIRNLQQQTYNEKGFMEVAKQIDEKWNEYNLLHSLYDTNGKLKKDVQIVKDPDTGQEMEIITNDLSIAKKLIEYRDQMSKYQEYVPISGAFDGALKRYEQELLNQGITGEEFAKARNAWIDRNTRVVIKKEFWEKRRQIMTRVKELLSKLPRPEEKIRQLDEAFKNINDAVIGFRDEDGQPNGTALSPGRLKLVKESMDTIERLKEEIPTTFGLTNAQREEMEYLENMEAYSFAGLNDQDYKKLVALRELRKKNLKDFTKEMGSELRGLLKSLEELQSNMPTEYYLGQLNAVIENIDSDEVKQQLKFTFGPDKLDADAANNLLNIGPADRYRNMLVKLMENADFKAWFEANHIKKTRRVYDAESETYTQEVYYQRLYTWNVIRPNDPQYYEQHQILDENGKPVGDPIKGLPSRRFYKREVKDEYRTGYDKNTKQVKLIVGVHVDNKNKWLPRENAPNNPYRNQAYYDMKNNDPKLFKLLEAMKRKHLEFQEGLDNASKLYLDFPRFAKSNLELLQTKRDAKVKGNWFRLLLRRIKEFFKGSKEEPESGHNWSDDYKVATLDIFDKDEYSIPIRGLYDIALDDVSTDITNSMLRYMISAEENKRLNEIHPVAVAMRQTLQSNGADNFRRMMKRNLNSGEFTYRNKDMNKIRREVVNNFIERTFYGQVNKGPFHDNKFLQNLSQGMFQMASLGFFAFNIPSALKNQLGAKIQNFIEGAAGMHYTLKDLAKAEIWSNATMGEVSMQIYKKSPKSLNVQLWEVFDPVFSFQQKTQKEGMSRTFLKDLSEPTGLAMNFRKWTEMQGSMQLFGAMLYATKVKMGDKTISLMDAWEVREGKIQLKEGVDPEYGITYDADGNQKIGKKFLEVKNKIQAVHRKLQGAYDEFNQPEAQRYMGFRFVSFLRRYFTTMLMDRFGFKYKNGQVQPRFNPGLGSMDEGFYVTLLRYLGDVFRHGPKRFVYATPEERRAILKTTVDVAILVLMTLAISHLFAWDPDDDERYEKLRQKSGPLRLFPFVAEDEYQFHMGGWLSNHMLNLIMQMRGEQNQFLPLPGMGLDDYKEMITEVGSSAAFGPTLEMGFSIVQDLTWMGTGSEKAYYQREVGPYTWQQDGGSKFMAHLAKMVALTGTTIDPSVGIKSYQSIELGFNR